LFYLQKKRKNGLLQQLKRSSFWTSTCSTQ